VVTVSGTISSFVLYDVGDAIDLGQVVALVGSAQAEPLRPKAAVPHYVQYQQPPVTIDSRVIEAPDVDGFRARFKVFDYGVVSVGFSKAFSGTWDGLLDAVLAVHDSSVLASAAEESCRRLMERLRPAGTGLRSTFLAEDYLVVALTTPSPAVSSTALIQDHGVVIAQLLRGERNTLSEQERNDVLRNRISYLETDLLIPTWNGAFICDNEAGIRGTVELLEFVNSQLLQFRYYDRLLDDQLQGIYGQLQQARWGRAWLGRRYTRAAHQVHALFIDVTDLTARTENALNVAGDTYAARVLALTGARLGLDEWKASVREKLHTLDAIYRFAVERTAMARGEFLEATVVAILVLELVLLFFGVMT
jgi:hypothetical protein